MLIAKGDKVGSLYVFEGRGEVGAAMAVEDSEVGKKNQVNFLKTGNKKKDTPLELVHLDVFGPTEVASIGAANYFVTFLDEYTRKVWIYMLAKKSEVFSKFKSFKALVENQIGHKIKCLKIDNRGEFCSSEFDSFCADNSIRRIKVIPFTRQENGAVKRLNRMKLKKARCMLSNAGLGKEFPTQPEPFISVGFWYSERGIAGKNNLLLTYPEDSSSYNDARIPTSPSNRVIEEDGNNPTPSPADTEDVLYKCKMQGEVTMNPAHEEGRLTTSSLQEDHVCIRCLDPHSPHNLNTHASRKQCPSLPTDAHIAPNLPMPQSAMKVSRDPSLTEADTDVNFQKQSNKKYYELLFVEEAEPTLLISEHTEPANFNAAMEDDNYDKWKGVIHEEMDTLIINQTWELVRLPPNRKAFRNKWIYKLKEEYGGQK
ncbi:uncharacterized protein LOC131868740 [Cryptomeria japonica]|uniref:uncharacterized protein LOC131868740 n=1 Tax=Cryptomeria japonica TaxID=3369 RepID=UPI0027DA9298|nr:uncharacterized protein LOC131868740 [Cryptomeria japonica]